MSRVVNDRPGVSDTVRDRVTDALRQLRWEPSGIKGGRQARSVGLLFPELTNPIFPIFAQGIEWRLGLGGMITVLCTSSPDGVNEQEHVDELLDMGIAALVFVAGSHADNSADHGMYTSIVERGVPTIVVNGRADGLEHVASVTCDDVESGRMATEHLTRLGHRRVGLAAGRLDYVAGRNRRAGWERALEQADVTVDGRTPVHEDSYTVDGGRRAGEALLDQGVTGVVCASDVIAIGVMEAAQARGLRIPEDISVVGYDDSMLMRYLNPPLTTVRQPIDAMCSAIARLCTDATEGRDLATQEFAYLPELIARSSTGPVQAVVS